MEDMEESEDEDMEESEEEEVQWRAAAPAQPALPATVQLAAALQVVPPVMAQQGASVPEPPRLVECPVCRDALPDRMAVPCGHALCCVCATRVWPICPICKEPISGFFQGRFSL